MKKPLKTLFWIEHFRAVFGDKFYAAIRCSFVGYFVDIDFFDGRVRVDPALSDAAFYRDVAGVVRAVYLDVLTAASARGAVCFDTHYFFVAFGVAVASLSDLRRALEQPETSRKKERRK